MVVMLSAGTKLACLLPFVTVVLGQSTATAPPTLTLSTAVATATAAATAGLPSQVALPPKQAWCPSEIFCAGPVSTTIPSLRYPIEVRFRPTISYCKPSTSPTCSRMIRHSLTRSVLIPPLSLINLCHRILTLMTTHSSQAH